MKISSDKKVNEFLIDIESTSASQHSTVLAIRDLFLNTNDALIEGIKYGGIAFNLSENLVGGIYVYKNHISIEFSDGADFSDEHSKLEGSGKRRRHIKVHSPDDLALKNLEYYIKQAVID